MLCSVQQVLEQYALPQQPTGNLYYCLVKAKPHTGRRLGQKCRIECFFCTHQKNVRSNKGQQKSKAKRGRFAICRPFYETHKSEEQHWNQKNNKIGSTKNPTADMLRIPESIAEYCRYMQIPYFKAICSQIIPESWKPTLI